MQGAIVFIEGVNGVAHAIAGDRSQNIVGNIPLLLFVIKVFGFEYDISVLYDESSIKIELSGNNSSRISNTLFLS